MTLALRWPISQLRSAELGSTDIWVRPGLRSQVQAVLPGRMVERLADVDPDADTLVVVGGGVMIDQAKVFRVRERPTLRLIAIPSVWGSGAEASPVAVLNHAGGKEILLGPEFVPDIRVEWPALLESVPVPVARFACGDTWAHALEAFLSPLANHDLRVQLADLIARMLDKPLGADPEWLELSAEASAQQARASVGLVHGIAHVLEPLVAPTLRTVYTGHAGLCSILLAPVMCFNRDQSSRWSELTSQYGLESERIIAVIRGLFDDDAYVALTPFLKDQWRAILMDRCTRTNSVLVRPGSREYFTERRFA